VKKAAASGGPSSSEQGSIWLVVEAPVDNGSGTILGCTSVTACRRTTVAEQRRSGAGAWMWKWQKGEAFSPARALYSHARRLEKAARATAGVVVAVKLGAAERRRRSHGHGKAAAAAVQVLAGQLGASVRTGSPTGWSRAVFDFS
jgi:hypothetical protein